MSTCRHFKSVEGKTNLSDVKRTKVNNSIWFAGNNFANVLLVGFEALWSALLLDE